MIFFIVQIDCWQRQFESAAVDVRPWQCVSSRKGYLCLGTATSLVSDLEGTAVTADDIDG